MTDADRKYLTEWMGECNHGLWEKWPNGYKCGSCGITFYKKPAAEVRTFTAADDMMAVKRRLAENGEWREFYMFSMRAYKKSFYLPWKLVGEDEVSCWLLDESRFCQLAADYLRREKDA